MKKTALAFLLATCFMFCHKKSTPDAMTGNGFSLENTHWKLVALNNLPGGLPSMPKDAFLLLKDGKLNGFSGCNNYFGTYTFSVNTIHFSGIGMTKMYCKDAMDVENGLSQALTNANQFRISSTHLELLQNTELLASFEGSASP